VGEKERKKLLKDKGAPMGKPLIKKLNFPYPCKKLNSPAERTPWTTKQSHPLTRARSFSRRFTPKKSLWS
jgi:hypothetical protein